MSRPRVLWGRTTPLVVVAVLIAAAFGVVYVQGRRAPQGTPDDVALGSSFAAGADLGPLQKASPWLCARSVNGYPQQLARLRHIMIVDMTCGGSTAKNVLHGGQFFQGPQIKAVAGATRLVTMTAGGNDIGYLGDLGLLAARRTHTPFGWAVKHLWKGPKSLNERDFAGVQGELTASLNAIHIKAPQARVVLVTYPTILPAEGSCPRLGLSLEEAHLMRQVGDRLALVTRAAANAAGAILVDMNVLGEAHNACSTMPWTRGWTNGGAAPFHPTLEGAEATADAVSAALGP